MCGKKSIALSYAFDSRDHDPELISAASKLSTKLIEKLVNEWPEDVHLYSINIPLRAGVSTTKIVYTDMLQNTWKSGSSFEQVSHPDEEPDPAEHEKQIREGTEVWQSESNGDANRQVSRKQRKSYKWAPQFADVKEAVEKAGRGDGWTVLQGWVRYVKCSFLDCRGRTNKLFQCHTTKSKLLAPASLQRGDQAVSKYLIKLLRTFGSIVLLREHVEESLVQDFLNSQEMITDTRRPQKHNSAFRAHPYVVHSIFVPQKALCLDRLSRPVRAASGPRGVEVPALTAALRTDNIHISASKCFHFSVTVHWLRVIRFRACSTAPVFQPDLRLRLSQSTYQEALLVEHCRYMARQTSR